MSDMDKAREAYFQKCMDEAEAKFQVTEEVLMASTAYVEGEPGNFTRVSVLITTLPVVASQHEGGGQYLVACLSPYKTSTVMSFDPTVHPSYVMEKLAPRDYESCANGGDLMGVTLCVRRAFELLRNFHQWRTEEM
jgi:hypothetical protein